MITCVQIRDELKNILENNYPTWKTKVEQAAGKNIKANIEHFYTTSFKEVAFKADEFGLIWIENNHFRSVPPLGERPLANTLVFQIHAVMIERDEMIDEMALVQEVLSRTMVNNLEDLELQYSVNMESAEELDLRNVKGDARYMSTGIILTIERGI